MMIRSHALVGVVFAFALLSGCGGGGGGDAPPPAPPAPPPATPLPDSVTITADARVEAGTSEAFSTSVAAPAGLTFQWDFGDGSTGSGATPAHVYAAGGDYAVTLVIGNGSGAQRSATAHVQAGHYSNVAALDCSGADSAGWCWQNTTGSAHMTADVAFADATHAWAVGAQGMLLRSTDGGDTWSRVTDSGAGSSDITAVRFRDVAHGVVATGDGVLLTTADGGATWNRSDPGPFLAGGRFAVLAYDASRLVVANGGAGATSADDGRTWTGFTADGIAQVAGANCLGMANGQVTRVAGCAGTGTTITLDVPPDALSTASGALSMGSPTQGLVLGSSLAIQTEAWSGVGWSTTDGGATWSRFAPAGLEPFRGEGYALRMLDAADGWLVGFTQGGVTHDGGRTWTRLPASPWVTAIASHSVAMSGLADGAFWQANGNRAAITVDEGRTWTTLELADEGDPNHGGYGAYLQVLHYLDAAHFVVSYGNRVYTTHDGGRTMQRVIGPDARDVASVYGASWFFDAKKGLVLDARGGLLATSDGGRSWTRSNFVVADASPVALHFDSATDGWMLLGGALSHTSDGGATWSTPTGAAALHGLAGMSWGDAAHGWAWTGATLYATADGGAHWAPLAPTVPGILSAVLTGPLTGIVNAGYGHAATTADGGATWTTIATGLDSLVHTGGHTVWSYGYGASRSDDDGATWTTTALPSHPYIASLAFADPLDGWAVGVAGAIFHTVDGGATWQWQGVATDIDLTAVAAVDAATAWVLTTDGEVLATATAGH